MIILLTFLALDLYLAYLLRTISKAYQTEKELELVTQQSMLQLNAYNELQRNLNTYKAALANLFQAYILPGRPYQRQQSR